MEIRYHHSPEETRGMDSEALRRNFLAESLMKPGKITAVYTHYDRVIVAGIMPSGGAIELISYPALKAEYFLERREAGIINTGGEGEITADGKKYLLRKLDCLYIGKGVKQVSFSSTNNDLPATFYLLSAPAHQQFPVQLMSKEDASPTEMGSQQTSNQRTIYKYIYADGLKSCQLVMGLTLLKEGSVWNTMPAHTHDRRMEAYFYFDMQQNQRVFHFMGQPSETRHLLVNNNDAVISPPWSIHSGCGTSSYSFIWGMAGENYSYTDMDMVDIADLR